MAVFFTSDTHFGDPRVLRIDKRPFKTIPEHDEALIAHAFRKAQMFHPLKVVSDGEQAMAYLLDRLSG